MKRNLLLIAILSLFLSVFQESSSYAVIKSMISESIECKTASSKIQSMDSVGTKLFSAYQDSYKAMKKKSKDISLNNQTISTLIDLLNNDKKIFTFSLANLNCFSQTNIDKIEYLKEVIDDLIPYYKDYKNKLGLFTKYGDLYPKYVNLSETLSLTVIPPSFKPTATPKPKLDSTSKSKNSASNTSTSAYDLQSKLDAACKYAVKAFSLDYPKFKSEAPGLFANSAKIFHPLIISFNGASNLMAGALAASREAHRWTNGATLIQAAFEKSYITKDDGNNILALRDYCAAGSD